MEKKYTEDQVRFVYYHGVSNAWYDSSDSCSYERFEDTLKYCLSSTWFPPYKVSKEVIYVTDKGEIGKDSVYLCRVPSKIHPRTLDFEYEVEYEDGKVEVEYSTCYENNEQEYINSNLKERVARIKNADKEDKIVSIKVYKMEHFYKEVDNNVSMDNNLTLCFSKDYSKKDEFEEDNEFKHII